MKKILYGLLAFLFILPISFAVVGCKKQTYTISFMVGEEIYQTATVEAGQKLPKIDNPEKDNYDFMGWYLSEVSQKQVTDKDSINGNLKVYARFKATKYTIEYELYGGMNVGANKREYTVEDAFTFAKPTRPGYLFEAWYDNEDFEGDPITGIEIGTTGNKKFYSKWNIATYSITYNLLDGENNDSNPSSYTYETDTITLASPTKVDENGVRYSFIGWYTDQWSGVRVTTIPKYSTGNYTLFARWEETFEINENMNTQANAIVAELEENHYNQHANGDILTVNDLNLTNGYYVKVGEFLNIDEIESISFGNVTFEKDQTFLLSIGNNAKVSAVAFYTTDNADDDIFSMNDRIITTLYIAAPIIATESIANSSFNVNSDTYLFGEYVFDELEITEVAIEANDTRNIVEEVEEDTYLCTITTGTKFVGFGTFDDNPDYIFLTRKFKTYADNSTEIGYGLTDLDDISGSKYVGYYVVGWIEDSAADKAEKLAAANGLEIEFTMFAMKEGAFVGAKTLNIIVDTDVE